MARDAQADGRADHPDLISIPRITIELDPYAGGYFAQVARSWLLSVMVFLSGHTFSWRGSRAAAGSG